MQTEDHFFILLAVSGPVFPQQINLPTDDLIDELPVEK